MAVVVVLDAPTPCDLNLMQCRLPILHSPLTLSPAATLELDFLPKIRLVFPRAPDTGTTQTHAILSSSSGLAVPDVLNLIHCRLPVLHIPLTLSPAATLELDFLRQIRSVYLGS